jgi:hypothetical protein
MFKSSVSKLGAASKVVSVLGSALSSEVTSSWSACSSGDSFTLISGRLLHGLRVGSKGFARGGVICGEGDADDLLVSGVEVSVAGGVALAGETLEIDVMKILIVKYLQKVLPPLSSIKFLRWYSLRAFDLFPTPNLSSPFCPDEEIHVSLLADLIARMELGLENPSALHVKNWLNVL